MRILIYGNKQENSNIRSILQEQTPLAFQKVCYEEYENYEEFIRALRERETDIVFVLVDGADGMESVIATKALQDSISVLWFSSDRGFVAQSYRLGVDYFSEKPITQEKVMMALKRIRLHK